MVEAEESAADPEQQPEGSLRYRTVLSSVLVAGLTGSTQVFRLIGNIVLARILLREDFAVVALVQVLMHGAVMLTDLGIRDSVVRSNRSADRKFLDTAWTIQAMRGVMIWLVVCALAIPYASYYDKPILAQLAPVAALQIVLVSLQSTKEILLERNLQLKRMVPIELGSQLVGIGSMIGLAWAYASPWALVLGTLIGLALRCLLTWIAIPGPNNRWCMEAEARRDIVTFGRWILVSSLLWFGASSLDRLVFGKVLSEAMLGVYVIALNLGSAPQQVIQQIGTRVVLPAYRALVGRGDALGAVFESARRPLLVVAGWMLAGIAACAQPVVDILYPDTYQAAGLMLSLLTLSAWFQTLSSTNASAVKVLGKPRVLALGSLVQVLVLAIGLPLATVRFGVNGGILVLAGGMFGNVLVTTLWLRREGMCGLFGALPLTLWAVASAAGGYLVEQGLDAHPLLRILAAGTVTTTLWAPMLWSTYQRMRGRGRAEPVPA